MVSCSYFAFKLPLIFIVVSNIVFVYFSYTRHTLLLYVFTFIVSLKTLSSLFTSFEILTRHSLCSSFENHLFTLLLCAYVTLSKLLCFCLCLHSCSHSSLSMLSSLNISYYAFTLLLILICLCLIVYCFETTTTCLYLSIYYIFYIFELILCFLYFLPFHIYGLYCESLVFRDQDCSLPYL
jgi:hypothetical protein